MPHVLVDSDMMEERRFAGKTRRKGWEERDGYGRRSLSEEIFLSTGAQGRAKEDVHRDGKVSWAGGDEICARFVQCTRAATLFRAG